MFWLKLYGENDSSVIWLCDLNQDILVEKRRATCKHFEASIEKREPRGNISQPRPAASASKTFPSVPFFLPWLQKPFTRCPFFLTSITWEKPNYTWNIFPESSQNNYSNNILFLNPWLLHKDWLLFIVPMLGSLQKINKTILLPFRKVAICAEEIFSP